MEDNTNKENNNNFKFIELKPDCFKKMTEEEKQKHTKYAVQSIGDSIGAISLALGGALLIILGKLYDGGISAKIFGILMLLIAIVMCVNSITFAISELQINKLIISKIAYISSLIVGGCCVIIFIVSMFFI